MSATNKTTNYDLPIFVGTDKPSWLGDWNSAMTAIDTAIAGAKSTGDSATTVAGQAKSTADAASETATAASETAAAASKAANNAMTIANNANTQAGDAKTDAHAALAGIGKLNTKFYLFVKATNVNYGASVFYSEFISVIKYYTSINNITLCNKFESDSAYFIDLCTYDGNIFKLLTSTMTQSDNMIFLNYVDIYSDSYTIKVFGAPVYVAFDGSKTHILIKLTTNEYSTLGTGGCYMHLQGTYLSTGVFDVGSK